MAEAPPMLLSKGRYWIDLIGPQRIGNFFSGVKGLNEAHPNLVRIVSATSHNQNEVRDWAESAALTGQLVQLWEAIAGQIPDTPERVWALFEVSDTAVWDPALMGVPTPAPDWVHSEGDTVQRPDPELDPSQQAKGLEKGISDALNTLAWIVGIGIAAAVIWRAKK